MYCKDCLSFGVCRYASGLCYWHTLSDFGKVLFLSYKEAERVLKEYESNEK